MRYEVIRLSLFTWVIFDNHTKKLVKDGGGVHLFFFKRTAQDHAFSLQWQHDHPHDIHPYFDVR